jgi:hypothetical protein
MVWPVIGAIAGGLIARDAARDSNRFNLRQAREQMAAQKEFAQHGIRWKVEDAKAAGLHPLYALGSQPAQYNPVMVQDSVGPAMAEAGQNLGRAIGATQTSGEKMMARLAVRQAVANIEETDARRDYYRSQASAVAQPQVASAEMPPVNAEESIRRFFRGDSPQYAWDRFGVYGPAPQRGVVEMKVPDIPWAHATDPSLVGGAPPMWREYEVAPNRFITLPASSNPAESLEALSESVPMMWAVYRENVARYGEGWGKWFMERYVADKEVSSPWETFKNWAQKRRAVQDAAERRK